MLQVWLWFSFRKTHTNCQFGVRVMESHYFWIMFIPIFSVFLYHNSTVKMCLYVKLFCSEDVGIGLTAFVYFRISHKSLGLLPPFNIRRYFYYQIWLKSLAWLQVECCWNFYLFPSTRYFCQIGLERAGKGLILKNPKIAVPLYPK